MDDNTCLPKDSVRVNILGVGIDVVDMASAIARIDWLITNRDHAYVCVTGAHGIIESQSDEELRSIHNRAHLVIPDGMPLVWLSRLRGYSNMSRVPGPDLMLALCQHSVVKGYRHFFYGSRPSVVGQLEKSLCNRFPGLRVVGKYSPPFIPLTPKEDKEIVACINEAKPDIVWVGLSTPKQERWMADHLERISTPIMIGVGAAFDFNAGLKKLAPVWMRESGLEWLFRLSAEPCRLWRRYAWVVPTFVYLSLLQSTRLRSFPLDNDFTV
jgi:N-acetylglucosaminyldiphosphoundecaprenol N-acetyl-beta-D-mannosaminyltransferase